VHFTVAAETDVGTTKEINQDSILVRHGKYSEGEVLMAVICDGMGGLDKGELASATVIRAFLQWFDKELPYELENPDMQVIGEKWSLLLKELNVKIQEYGQARKISLGTTFTGMLLAGSQYVIVHVGDSRAYRIGKNLRQITSDHTLVARKLERGDMTAEQAKRDKRRSMLLQCVGASDILNPDVLVGDTEKGIYMLCSDGLRNEVTEGEIFDAFNPKKNGDSEAMHANAGHLIRLAKQRQEKDNISVILIRTDWE